MDEIDLKEQQEREEKNQQIYADLVQKSIDDQAEVVIVTLNVCTVKDGNDDFLHSTSILQRVSFSNWEKSGKKLIS